MVVNARNGTQDAAVLFSAGLDSAVLLADALREGRAVPVYVSSGLAWEAAELRVVEKLLMCPPFKGNAQPLVRLHVDMHDVYPASHWAIRGEAPAFDTPDEDVYIEGRNIILLSKTAVFMAHAGLRRALIGSLAGNPFPDATPEFLDAIASALTLGLKTPIEVDAPFARLHKSEVIRKGRELGVPMELTLSCMQPLDGVHCGRCSKCRERQHAFNEAGIQDPTAYVAPGR
jgi:7-cyano-7-deazaguanine synthase